MQKLTEEQQRNAYKIIKANRGDCKKGIYLNCFDCPRFYNGCSGDISDSLPLDDFKADNLRISQKWLDAHPATPQEILIRPNGHTAWIPATRENLKL